MRRQQCRLVSPNGWKARAANLPPGQHSLRRWKMQRLHKSTFEISRQPLAFTEGMLSAVCVLLAVTVAVL